MKIPKETAKVMGVANNIFNLADMGKTAYEVYTGKKQASEMMKKVSAPAISFAVKKGLAIVGIGTGTIVSVAAGLAVTAALEKAMD